jgi:hypothetical protein
MVRLDAQFDEAEIAMGDIPSIKELANRIERLLGSRSAYVGPQRPRISFAGQALASLERRVDADRYSAFQGEHNWEVFGELGVDQAELQKPSESGALVSRPRAHAI